MKKPLLTQETPTQTTQVNHLVFSRTSTALLSSSKDGSIRVWEPESGAALRCNRSDRLNWTAHVVCTSPVFANPAR